MHVGFGYDVHKLVEKRRLVVGGEDIPYARGLLGWSDGDVLLHAVIDALIGAVGEGDIGRHFPPGDDRFKGISSLKLLSSIKKLLRERGYTVSNVDSTIVAEEPSFAPHIENMRKNIADALGIKKEKVNVKAKTEEGLGFTGAREGISAYAVCLVQQGS